MYELGVCFTMVIEWFQTALLGGFPPTCAECTLHVVFDHSQRCCVSRAKFEYTHLDNCTDTNAFWSNSVRFACVPNRRGNDNSDLHLLPETQYDGIDANNAAPTTSE